jgi:hypothetical protein
VIDKLELSVASRIPFTPAFESVCRRIRPAPSKFYKARLDLRKYWNVILHRSCRFNGTHKLVIVNSAEVSVQQMDALIGQIFQCDPLALRVARVDLAADVPGIPVQWFRVHMRVLGKRRIRVFGVNEGSQGEGDGTTYFGDGADLIRLYDKAAELRSKSGRLADTDRCVLTRIERQLRSGRIPHELATLGDLSKNAATFNPFASVILLPGGKLEPKMSDYRIRSYLEGMGLRQIVLKHGFANAWSMLNTASRGNAARRFRRLGDFLPPALQGVQVPDLFVIFQNSLHWQLSSNPAKQVTSPCSPGNESADLKRISRIETNEL